MKYGRASSHYLNQSGSKRRCILLTKERRGSVEWMQCRDSRTMLRVRAYCSRCPQSSRSAGVVYTATCLLLSGVVLSLKVFTNFIFHKGVHKYRQHTTNCIHTLHREASAPRTYSNSVSYSLAVQSQSFIKSFLKGLM